jgi:hypothetical protein
MIKLEWFKSVRVHEIQILLRTDTRLLFSNRKIMRTDIFFTRTTKPICNFVNSGRLSLLNVFLTFFLKKSFKVLQNFLKLIEKYVSYTYSFYFIFLHILCYFKKEKMFPPFWAKYLVVIYLELHQQIESDVDIF